MADSKLWGSRRRICRRCISPGGWCILGIDARIGFLVWGVTAFAGLRSWRPSWRELVGLFFLLSASGLFYKAFTTDPLFGATTLAGGIVGYGVVMLLNAYLGSVGSWVLLGSVLLASFVGITGFSFKKMILGLAIAHWWFFSRIFSVFKRTVLGAVRGAVFSTRKLCSVIAGFPSFLHKRETCIGYAETIAGSEEAGTGTFVQDGGEPRLHLMQKDSDDLILEPNGTYRSNQKNGRRVIRPSKQNGPSLFGGEKFPEPSLPALRGPAAGEEEAELAESPKSHFNEEMPDSVLEKLLQDDGDIPPTGDGAHIGLPSNVAEEHTPMTGMNIDDEVKHVSASRKSVTAGLRIKRKKNLDDNSGISPASQDESPAIEETTATLSDSLSTRVEGSIKSGESEENIKVRHAGTVGESDCCSNSRPFSGPFQFGDGKSAQAATNL